MVGAAYVVLHKEKGAVCVLWCGEGRGQRERRVWRCVRSNIVLTSTFGALRGTAINGDPGSKLRHVGEANTCGGGPHALSVEAQQW